MTCAACPGPAVRPLPAPPPADTAPRTLTVHVGGWASSGTLAAHLSDGSAADHSNTTVLSPGRYDCNYTLTYKAADAGQSLPVTWMQASSGDNVTLTALPSSNLNNKEFAAKIVKCP